MSDYVRVSINANEVKREVSEMLDRRVLALGRDRDLRNDLARIYGNVVTDYVPRSNRPASKHHLQAFNVSDGRVKWYRQNSAGEEIADRIFSGDTRGVFHSRYGGHMPQRFWTDAVQPGTPAWDRFIGLAALAIQEKGHFR